MIKSKYLLFGISFVCIGGYTVVFTSCAKEKGKLVAVAPPPAAVSFANDIMPIMTAKCTNCHSGGMQNPDLDTYTPLKASVDNGTFKNRVLVLQDMPPGGVPLSAADQQKIQVWLDNGAPNN